MLHDRGGVVWLAPAYFPQANSESLRSYLNNGDHKKRLY